MNAVPSFIDRLPDTAIPAVQRAVDRQRIELFERCVESMRRDLGGDSDQAEAA